MNAVPHLENLVNVEIVGMIDIENIPNPPGLKPVSIDNLDHGKYYYQSYVVKLDEDEFNIQWRFVLLERDPVVGELVNIRTQIKRWFYDGEWHTITMGGISNANLEAHGIFLTIDPNLIRGTGDYPELEIGEEYYKFYEPIQVGGSRRSHRRSRRSHRRSRRSHRRSRRSHRRSRRSHRLV